jgi:exosortase
MLTRRSAFLAIYCACLMAGNIGLLREFVAYSQKNDYGSHVVFVPLVSLLLIVVNRRTCFSLVRTDLWPGLVVITLGAALLAFDRLIVDADVKLAVRIGASVVLAIGGFVMIFGRHAARAAIFPLGFLFLMIPIPNALLALGIATLKAGTIQVVSVLFALTGTPTFREGAVFYLPSLTIEVADACSGIRSSIALGITSLLAGQLFLSRPVSRLVLVLAIFPIALLKNGVRIVTLSLLTIHVDPGFIEGRLHHEGGVVFFLPAVVALLACLEFLRRAESTRQPPTHIDELSFGPERV